MCVFLIFFSLALPIFVDFFRWLVYDFYRRGIKNNGEIVAVLVVDVFVNLMLSSDRLLLLLMLMSHTCIHITHALNLLLLVFNV